VDLRITAAIADRSQIRSHVLGGHPHRDDFAYLCDLRVQCIRLQAKHTFCLYPEKVCPIQFFCLRLSPTVF